MVRLLFEKKYRLINSNLKHALDRLAAFTKEIVDDCYVLVEHPYVDKTYRDTYYNYYASKRDGFARNCIRLSFFKKEITEAQFRTDEALEYLQSHYLGFLVIRPTFPNVIGRSLLDPLAFGKNDVKTCRIRYEATCNSIKLKVSGFPHSSQDGEVMTCAETTVWSVMEYFGFKYAEYAPVKPSQVNSILGKFAFERLIPSKGLTAAQISYALRELGYGVKIYSKTAYSSNFFQLLRTYAESGIPVVGLVQNNKGIGHALNIIGRSAVQASDVQNLPAITTLPNGSNVYDFAEMDLQYVFIDDNHEPYKTCSLLTPCDYYESDKWEGCELRSFIVPLYPKIYLEAGEARSISLGFIETFITTANSELLIRTFLASSRSFKNAIALDTRLNDDVKEMLLGMTMPKFIWVTEVSNKEMALRNEINGIIVLDATEPKRAGVIAGLLETQFITNNLTSFQEIKIPLQAFSSLRMNLN